MNIKNFEIKNKKINSLVEKCTLYSFFLSCASSILIGFNLIYFIHYNLFIIGVYLFQTGLTAALFSYVCGLFFDRYVLNNT